LPIAIERPFLKSLAVRNRTYELHEVGLRRLLLACEGRLRAFCCRDFNRRSEFQNTL